MRRLLFIPLALLVLSCDDNNNDIDAPPAVDCAGMEGGSALLDSCGTCDGDPLNNCVQDCEDVWGGGAEIDACGVCSGDGSSCQLNFMLTDINPLSPTFGQLVGPQSYRSKVSLYYFPFSET